MFYPAIAMASKVLPEPGGPETKMPLGGDTPSHLKIVAWSMGHSIIYLSYWIVSFIPPTSSNFTSDTTLNFSSNSSAL